MHVVLLALGSRGDVEPLNALGLGLLAAGYDVTLVLSRDLADTVHGLRTDVVDLDIRALSADGPALTWQAEGSRGLWHEARSLARLAEVTAEPVAQAVLRTTADADLVVSGALTYAAASVVCRARGVRNVLALMAPVLPAREGASTVFAALPTRRSVLNTAGGWLGAGLAYRLFLPAGRRVRTALGVHRRSVRSDVRTAYATPTLLGVSPVVVPPTPDWGRQVRATGWWRMPQHEVAPERCTELTTFLAAGTPPVLLGFGSMMSKDPAATTATMLEGLRRTGRRGLLSAGWAGLDAPDLGEDVLAIGEVPHAWLLPQLAAIVHHGGSGTTGAAVRAGVPQVVVPHVGDQFYWGRRMHQLGVAAAPVRRHRLSAERLAEALHTALEPAVLERARSLASQVADEDGVATAVALITGLAPPDA